MFQQATVLHDIRYGFRTLLKSPGFALTAIASLALGIGANTAVFTLVNGVLLNPLPLKDTATLAAVYTSDSKPTARASTLLPVSYLNFKDFEEKSQAFAGLAAFSSPMPFGFTKQAAAAPERVFGELVTHNYFNVLGLRPVRGRFFLPEENRTPGTHAVAVIGYGMWQRRFGGAADVIGQTVRLNSVVFIVIGVAPENFKGVNAVFGPDLWIPSMMAERALPIGMRNWLRERGVPAFRVAGRLRTGVTRAGAEANFKTIAAALEREFPEANKGHSIAVRPITEAAFSPGTREPALFGSAVLMIIVGLVLLIACSNVANLLLARAAGRQQEMAVRAALGASRVRIVRQLLVENLLLALIAGACSLGVAYEAVQFLKSFRPAQVAQNLANPELDPTVLAFALAVSVVTALVFGTVPALVASRPDVAEALKEEARAAGRSRRRSVFSSALLVLQVAFSLVSLATAALFLHSIQSAYRIDPGFETKNLALLVLNPGQAGYDQTRSEEFYREVRERTSAVPGIKSMSLASNLPLWGRLSQSILIEGQEQRDRSNPIMIFANTVDVNYFPTFGIGLIQGREFTEADREGAAPVAIVNEAMARRYWPGQDVTGRRLRFSGESFYREIVGVVKNANYQSLGEPPQPCAYIPMRQSFSNAMILYVRTQSDPASVLSAVQGELRRIDSQVPIEDVRTIRTVIDQALWGAKLGAGLLSAFGFLSLGLASIGLYGVMAYTVSRRRREIGVRMALGADRPAVLGLVVRQGMRIVGIGLAIGLAANLLAARALSRLLYGVSPIDPISLASASLILALVALLACYLPARSASRIDPLVALREA